MIIVAQAPLILVLLYLAALAAAAVEDGYRRRVSNLAVLAIAASGIAGFIITGYGLRLWEPVLAAAAVLAIGTALFARGALGGGDVKLLAAGCFWYSLKGQLTYLAAALLMGGALAALAIAYRLFRGKREGGLRKGASVGIPYAIGIALGAGWTVYRYRLG